MTRHISSGAIFVLAYSVLLIIGGLLAWQIALRVEVSYPSLSLPVFLGLVAGVIVVGGAMAFHITPDDKPEHPH